MGIRFWRFRSQTPVTRAPERLTDMVEKLVRVGVLTPEEARVLASDVFNREFRKIGEAWTKQPLTRRRLVAEAMARAARATEGVPRALEASFGGAARCRPTPRPASSGTCCAPCSTR
ncbi:MAG TPA: hypothetical protein VFS43_00430 [Polyangiaceae bacterium]|nr:hypothetical protein [Polyangiaceae bacterium]